MPQMDTFILENVRNWKSAPYLMVEDGGRLRPLHCLVAEAMIGRPLRADEVVHHRDHNKRNNAPSNLVVMVRGEHSAMHARERAALDSRAKRCCFCNKWFKSGGIICPACKGQHGLDKPFAEWPEWARQYMTDRRREAQSNHRYYGMTVSLEAFTEAGGDFDEDGNPVYPDGWEDSPKETNSDR